jgi:hypothetical protein
MLLVPILELIKNSLSKDLNDGNRKKDSGTGSTKQAVGKEEDIGN